jgi:hypothetical protein
MSPRRNWDSPNPSLAGECAPPPSTGDTRLRVRGWGSPNSDDWKKSLALCLLCGPSFHRDCFMDENEGGGGGDLPAVTSSETLCELIVAPWLNNSVQDLKF